VRKWCFRTELSRCCHVNTFSDITLLFCCSDRYCVLYASTDGYNACILAYGQTGSGKTFTMVSCVTASTIFVRISWAMHVCELYTPHRTIHDMLQDGYGDQYGANYRTIQKLFDLLVLRKVQAEAHATRVEQLSRDGTSSANPSSKLATAAGASAKRKTTANGSTNGRCAPLFVSGFLVLSL
jgi:hypothetical protein